MTLVVGPWIRARKEVYLREMILDRDCQCNLSGTEYEIQEWGIGKEKEKAKEGKVGKSEVVRWRRRDDGRRSSGPTVCPLIGQLADRPGKY